ncbi:MAG: hypothetical protein COA78_07195 [Blastopirellula sp.]|nr:MAG: hypothetical protein COA78_07195 [Blastopirellula sp.]
MQMDQIYSDCRHFITYGKENVPLFNSVAYFGDRYELTMQVPVEIRSETSGSMIGEAQFYLNEVRAVDIPPSQIGASFSGGIEFGSTKWQQVYKADGDFGVIGFKINTVPVPVANFKVYSAASRPSN